MRKLSNKPAGREGFTLTEIMIVVLITAILAAIVVPMAVSASSVQAVAAGRMIASDLQYAQNEAITGQTPVTVTFDPGRESYQLANASGDLVHPITNNSYIVDFSADSRFGELDIVSASFGGVPSVSFDEMGAPSSAGSIVLQAGPHALRVDVSSATGTVTVVDTGW